MAPGTTYKSISLGVLHSLAGLGCTAPRSAYRGNYLLSGLRVPIASQLRRFKVHGPRTCSVHGPLGPRTKEFLLRCACPPRCAASQIQVAQPRDLVERHFLWGLRGPAASRPRRFRVHDPRDRAPRYCLWGLRGFGDSRQRMFKVRRPRDCVQSDFLKGLRGPAASRRRLSRFRVRGLRDCVQRSVARGRGRTWPGARGARGPGLSNY